MSQMLGPGDNLPGEILLEPTEAPESQKSPLVKLHQLLRGRYLWAICLGLVLAAIAALVVWFLPILQPDYKSDGQIRIRPALEPLMFNIPEVTRMPDYDQYIESQVPALKGQRAIMKAMGLSRDDLAKMKAELRAWDDRTWSDVAGNWGSISYDEQRARFAEGLQVTRIRGSQVLQVSFTDKDPALAAVAVKLTIAAYKQLYDVDVQNMSDRLARLLEKRKDLNKRVLALKDSITVALGTYGTEDFLVRTKEARQTDQITMEKGLEGIEMQVQGMAYRSLTRAQDLFRTNKLADAQSVLNGVLDVWPDIGIQNDNRPEQLRQLIAAARAAVPATAPATAPVTADDALEDVTPELLATVYPPLRDALKERADAERAYNIVRAGNAENSAIVRNAKTRLDVSQNQVDSEFQQALRMVKTSATQPGAQPSAGKITLTGARDMLRVSRDQVARHKSDLQDLQKRSLQLASIKTDLEAPQEELDMVDKTIRELQFENVTSGRTEVLSPGDIPVRPEKDRRIPAAIGSGLGGLALGLAIFALLGLLDRRVRSIADARDSLDGSNRILGILPALPEKLTDPEQAAAVAFAVHHIRTLLQLGTNGARNAVFAVTSAAPRDGKTSLVLSLGMSYASAGAKTLLIDSDLIGAGLTARLAAVARPRLGGILVRGGLVNREQLETALAEAQRTGRKIGETLVALGAIQPAELDKALAFQGSASTGFLDMLDGYALRDCIVSAGLPNLSVLPVGNLATSHFGQISLDAVRRIISEARKRFDIVIFDTGPLLGSLEAGVVAASADQVIVAVSRGQQRALLEQTFRRLNELGARVGGIVFNRAKADDIERSGYASSIASQRLQSPGVEGPEDTPETGDARRRLGPIAQALDPSAHKEVP